MNGTTRLAAAVFALMSAAGGAAAQDADLNARSYWNAAVALVTEGNKYLPTRMDTKFEELDGKGAVVSSETSAFALSYPPDGDVRRPKEKLLKAEKNGKDITEERRRNPAGPPPGQDSDGASATPLDPDFQNGVELLGMTTQYSAGRAIVEIAFEQPVGKRIYRGVVRIDAESGLPIDAVYGFKSNPTFIDEMETRIAYRVIREPSRKPAAGVVVDEVRFSAAATIIIIKKRFRGEIRFMDHVRKS